MAAPATATPPKRQLKVDAYDFDTDPDCAHVEIPVKYDGINYLLIPADGETGAKYNNARIGAGRFDGDKLRQVEGLGDVEIILVAGCLVHTTAEGTIKRDTAGKIIKPGEAKVKTFPYAMIKKLFDTAKEISCLDEKQPAPGKETDEGKPQGDSTDGSESPKP